MYELSPKNYTTTGKRKKSAKTEWEFHVKDDETIPVKDIAESIVRGRNVESIESPYFFTHIIMNADGKRYAIYEEVYAAGQYFMTSPTKLLAELTALRAI